MLDWLICGGDVVDGSGAPRRSLDVGIRGDRIVALGPRGSLREPAHRVLDAAGLIVAPGFVDVHTHYDAQAFWDGTLSPSPLHGVTSVVGGNCGFSIAPLRSDQADYLARMLARVEGMPLESLRKGVPWDWVDVASYLDRLEGRLSINAGFLVGHSALRRTVMGSDGSRLRATPDQLRDMRRLLQESLEAGALGFSSSWARTHNDGEGQPVPSRHAAREELIALCEVLAGFPGTSLEFIPTTELFEPEHFELMTGMSVAAHAPLNWNVLTVSKQNAEERRAKLAAGDHARERGGKVVALTLPISAGGLLSFRTGFVFDALPGWEHVMHLPPKAKLAALSDPGERKRLREGAANVRGALEAVANWANKRIVETFAPASKAHEGRIVAEIAREQGREPFDVLLDIIVADELMTTFTTPPLDDDEIWRARIETWRDPRAIIGASDAGAHLDLLAAFVYPTQLLAVPVRERGLIALEEAVHRLTDVPARLYGLRERGRIQQGWHADLVIFDAARIAPEPVHTRFDLPAGAGRLFAGATGIHHVFCGGQEIVAGQTLTDVRPGKVLRAGRDTEAIALA